MLPLCLERAGFDAAPGLMPRLFEANWSVPPAWGHPRARAESRTPSGALRRAAVGRGRGVPRGSAVRDTGPAAVSSVGCVGGDLDDHVVVSLSFDGAVDR